ncbi:putative fatty acyl-CoA reductase CG5065 [Chironomus tepperi]|uniref:putative fatty acyl-CoA reductase CG5065 n=1 Tax=Chironomus tepperi TaxID=113505 RepID=UPI00391F303D
MNQNNNPTPSIPEFYNGKSVFITGGTGFLGKILVEKLLRSCKGIENIYLLVRSKKGKNVTERLDELTHSQDFDILRKMDAQFTRKLVLIEGDTSKIGLGMSKENRALLCDKVSVIFHSAATVRFIETFKTAVNTNLRALDEMLKLGRELKDLKLKIHFQSFVHISTAYSNWFEPIVKEQFYPAAYDPRYIIDLCNSTPDDELEKVKL